MFVVNKRLVVDLLSGSCSETVHAVEGDSYTRSVELELQQGRKMWPIPSGISVLAEYIKSDGTKGLYDTLPDGTQAWSAEGNVLTLMLAPQLLTAEGSVMVQVRLMDGELQLSLPKLWIYVSRAITGGKSEDYIYLSAFLPQVEGAKVGQYFEVEEVDDSGRVTKIRTVDALQGETGTAPERLPNPFALTFTGAAEATYDGSEAVIVEIPDSSQNVDLDTTLTQSGKAADAKAVGDILNDILRRLGILESHHSTPIYNLPVLRLTGDTAKMTKDTEVVLTCEFVDIYGEPFFTDKVAEVKWQGDTSIYYNKHNYGIKLYENDGETKFKYKAFDDVEENNGYHIKANFIDAWHCRNIVTVNLAKDMYVKTLPSGARGVIDGFPIIVEINGEKQGLYTFNLKQHKSVYGLDEDNPNHLMYRAGSNGADVCKFRALSRSNVEDTNDDWEDRFPETNTAENRAKLNRLISFVKDSDDAIFKADFGQYLDLDYTIDYWILCYFGGFTDSLAKNMNIVTYDGNIWYPTFYDCDTTWGIDWNGNSQKDYNIQCPTDYEAKDSLLWERLVANFSQEIYDRYFALRDTYLKVDEVVGRMKAFVGSIPTEEYEEDRKIWTLPAASVASGIEYMSAWITKRAAYVDGKMNELIDASVALEGISISQTTNVSKGGTEQMLVTFTPTNATNKNVTWDSSDDTIATVDENGLVTAVGVGNCVITCISEDGGHTAECYLSVSEPTLTTDGMVYNFDLRQSFNSNNKWESGVNSYTLGLGTPSADKLTENGYALASGGTAEVSPAMSGDVDLDANGMTLEAVVYGNIPNQTFRIGNNFYFSPGQSSSFHMFDADGNKVSTAFSNANVINAESVVVPFADVIGADGMTHIVFRVDPAGVVDRFVNGCKFTPSIAPANFDHFEENLLNGIVRLRNTAQDIVLASYRAYGRPLTDEEIRNNYYVEKSK